MLIAGCDTPLSPIDDEEDPDVEDPVVIDPIPTCLTYEQGDELFPLYIESDEDNSWYSSLVSFNIAGGYFHATDSVKYELVETHATFQTEHGLFEDCIVFRFEEKTHDDMVFHWYHYIYVKPGIGIVGRRTLDILFAEDPDDKDLRVVGEWTLVEYDLN